MTLFDSTVRVRCTVAYDGQGFHGFAVNEGVRTVGGTLANAIRRVVGHPVTLTCAGRTDTGVHAAGQVVTFDAAGEGLDLAYLQRAINRLCAPAIAVSDVAFVPPEFDARFSATGRRYRYLVLNRAVPDPFLANRAWHVEQPLNGPIDANHQETAARCVVGSKDCVDAGAAEE